MPSCLIFIPNICSTFPSATALSHIRTESLLTPLTPELSATVWSRYVQQRDSPVTLIWHDRSLLEELLPLLRQRRQRKLCIRSRPRANVDFTIRDSRQDSVVATSSFDAERSRSRDRIRGDESRKLAIILCSFVGFLNGAGQLRRQIRPLVVARGFGHGCVGGLLTFGTRHRSRLGEDYSGRMYESCKWLANGSIEVLQAAFEGEGK